MKTSLRKISVGLGSLAVVALVISLAHPARSRSSATDERTIVPDNSAVTAKSHFATSIAPFIVRDTGNDSFGSNVVTFSAEIGGTPAPALQWKVDKGSGFTNIPGATNALYRIGNAQVEHNGFYALFATNSAGSIHSTPQRLFVEDGED